MLGGASTRFAGTPQPPQHPDPTTRKQRLLQRPRSRVPAEGGWSVTGTPAGTDAPMLLLWLSGALGLGSWGSLVTQATYADNRRCADDSLQYKSLRLGSRLLVGSARLNGFLEGEFESRWDRSRAIKKDDGQWSGGVEFRVSDALWLSTGLGEPYQALDQPDRTAVFANLRWGTSSKARMDPK